MTQTIKEIALNVAKKMRDSVYPNLYIFDSAAVAFTEALIAELAKQNEPVMVLFRHEDTGRTTSIEPQSAGDFGRINKRWINCGPLFSFPPTAEQIANETAKACAMVYLDTYDLTDIAEAIRSGAWKEFKK